MRRVAGSVDGPAFFEASFTRPCPICGNVSGCAVMIDDDLVRCRTEISDLPVAGGGWLHRVALGDRRGPGLVPN